MGAPADHTARRHLGGMRASTSPYLSNHFPGSPRSLFPCKLELVCNETVAVFGSVSLVGSWDTDFIHLVREISFPVVRHCTSSVLAPPRLVDCRPGARPAAK